MVLMSMDTYQRTVAMSEVYRKLMEAETELANGQTVDGASAFADLKARYK